MRRPAGVPQPSDFTVDTVAVPTPGPGPSENRGKRLVYIGAD